MCAYAYRTPHWHWHSLTKGLAAPFVPGAPPTSPARTARGARSRAGGSRRRLPRGGGAGAPVPRAHGAARATVEGHRLSGLKTMELVDPVNKSPAFRL